jgi:hypothetical protein
VGYWEHEKKTCHFGGLVPSNATKGPYALHKGYYLIFEKTNPKIMRGALKGVFLSQKKIIYFN